MPSRGTGAEPHAADLVLVRRVVDGDETALATLYDRYAGVVYSVVLRILRDPGAAEEILQDIFYQLWRNASNFDPARGTLPGWLLVSARNRAIDRLRRRNPDTTELAEQSVALPFNLEAAIAQNQLMSRVKAALAKLPPAQREALELAYFQGLTHSEIAQRTGEPLGTVKTRLRAAVQWLRRELNP
ncbi:MAG: sigma-70 family RNA polymerase sigma factor [Acidobacteria bacterium]|nr:sigma-70 family RNA polymerase sigma factor [Acidobacteriota bacterium]